jgi:hypothetical protein
MHTGAKHREDDRPDGQQDKPADLPTTFLIQLRLSFAMRFLGSVWSGPCRAAHLTWVPGW